MTKTPEFRNTIIYVENVAETLAFFNTAFDLPTKFMDETGVYGELDTGQTRLAFANWDFIQSNFETKHPTKKHGGFEIALAIEDIDGLVKKACQAGATLIAAPQQKPWGQTIAYVETPQGILVELCTPL